MIVSGKGMGKDSMKRVLIYMKKNDLAQIGGPVGYNYNLLCGMESLPHINIEINYLPGRPSVSKQANQKIAKINNKIVRNMLLAGKSIANKGLMMYGPKHKAAVDLSQYDAVHFHKTMDLYRAKDSLANYKGKVLLTSHTPTMPYLEVIDNMTDFEKRYMKWFYRKLPEIDRFAFERADYIIFPCPEAEEPYYHTWPGYDEFHRKNENKFRYLPTGTSQKTAQLSRTEVLGKYHIPQDAFVISYVGRHNEIKGYGDLKEVARELLEKYPNLYFLIAGKEGPMMGLKHPRWIEAGWTNDPGSIIKAADFFMLPNRETYFDLVMLEVLSLGQIVLASRTGGNRYFEQFGTDGILLYDSLDEAVEKVSKLYELSADQTVALRKANRELYEAHFTNKVFAEQYQRLMSSLV